SIRVEWVVLQRMVAARTAALRRRPAVARWARRTGERAGREPRGARAHPRPAGAGASPPWAALRARRRPAAARARRRMVAVRTEAAGKAACLRAVAPQA